MHQIFLPRSTSVHYHKFYRNLASANADNETFCTVRLTSPVAMVQSLQSKCQEFETTCSCFFFIYILPLFVSICLGLFNLDVPRPLSNDLSNS